MLIEVNGVQPSRQLSDYGVDSLMAVKLRNWISQDFGAKTALFENMSISEITNMIVACGPGEERCVSGKTTLAVHSGPRKRHPTVA